MTNQAPLWVREHGREFDVPDEIAQCEGLVDNSWHNDTCPRFIAPLDSDSVDVGIWVEHVDPEQRCYGPDAPRYVVDVGMWEPDEAERLEALGFPNAMGGETVWTGDDPHEAVAQLLAVLVRVQAALR